MKEIRINAKSIPNIEETKAKIDAGFKNIEIQLIHKFVSKEEYEVTKEMIEKYKIDISVVHTPLIKATKDSKAVELPLDRLLIDEYYEIFKDTCKYTQYIAKLESKRIKVVIHNDFSKELWDKTNLIEDKIGPLIKNVLEEYEDVDLVIENGTAVNEDEKRFITIFDMEDVSYTVKKLNNIIGNRAKALIDTCHMMINWEAWKKVSNVDDLTNWDDAFKKATKYTKLGLIHLNNMRENGFDRDHGRGFEIDIEQDMKKLKEIMEAYEKYTDCEITIEVYEDDYKARPNNIIKTKEALLSLGYNLNLG